ncbi:unnamed protein product [Moneuplotes crassus]|uniref:RRM domain-containing protein n=1 Tax=Euplotes crassus TaxID=5936 RepID=A0AAD1XKB9_EUPCR|nr:unnamed protein product [Moneuplotes crassus]
MSDSEDQKSEIEAQQEEEKVASKEAKKRKTRTRGSKKKKAKKDEEDQPNLHGTTEKGEKIFSIFLSGLPYECDEDKIREFLGNPKTIVDIKLPKYQDTGRCLGYSHVEFNRKKDYEHGLSLDGQKIGNRYIDIAPSKGKSVKKVVRSKIPPPGCRTIFVGNLPYDITEDQVGDKFRKFGEIDQVRFAVNYQTKVFKGFGYVDFKYPEAVPRALDFDGTEFKGRKLAVDFSTSGPRHGYKIRIHDEGNKLYNKGIKKEIAAKKRRKEKMRAKMEEGRDFA